MVDGSPDAKVHAVALGLSNGACVLTPLCVLNTSTRTCYAVPELHMCKKLTLSGARDTLYSVRDLSGRRTNSEITVLFVTPPRPAEGLGQLGPRTCKAEGL